jgi:hypothetical protein
MRVNSFMPDKKSGKIQLLFLMLLTVSTLRAQEYPNPDWHYLDKPEQAGWNTEQIERIHY